MQVSQQPYLKTYTFPLFSVAALLKLILIVITVGLPFFLTYSTPNFYLTSRLATAPTQQITPLPKYHIEITTSKSTYIYTNLFTYSSSRAISIEQLDTNGVLTFRTKWSRSDTAQRVLKAQISLFFNFVASGTTQFGIASGSVAGYNIAEASIAGALKVERGSGQGAVTQNNLTLNGYNFLQTQFQSSQSLNYLTFQYSSLPINLPSDMTTVTMTVNYASIYSTQETPSILGQLVWSWVQYFPILLSIYWILDRAFCYLLRERVIRCGVVHDREYLTLIEQQSARRERLRQV